MIWAFAIDVYSGERAVRDSVEKRREEKTFHVCVCGLMLLALKRWAGGGGGR